MSISCSCRDDCEWYWEASVDFMPFPTIRRQRCASCSRFIDPGSDVVKLYRQRYARSDIEERIHGEMVKLRPWWLCEECGGLLYALQERGFCIELGDGIPLKEQIELHNDAAGIPAIIPDNVPRETSSLIAPRE